MTEECFEVNSEVAVGDLNQVQNQILPVSQNVKVVIVKASIATSKDKALKSLKTEMKIVDGILVGDEVKYQNKSVFPSFMDLCIWAEPSVKNSDWYVRKQHLLGFKQFCKALDIDLSNVRINDEFISSLIGRELLVNITHEEESVETFNPETGKKERVKTGVVSERIRNFKKVV